MEKFLENIYEAEKSLKRIDHLAYVTYPLVKDKRIILKILVETKIIITKCINSILQYECLYKRIRLSKKPEENLRIFKIKCAPRYGLEIDEIKLILELFEIVDEHKKSLFEFKKDEKIVILSENSPPKVIVFEDIKGFLNLAKKILRKTKKTIFSHF